VTNDPNAPAWLFLKATGARPFHVVGRMIIDRSLRKRVAETLGDQPSNKAAVQVLPGAGESDEEGWPTAEDVMPSKKSAATREASDAAAPDEDGSEIIEVLLPDGESEVEYPTDAASDEEDSFVQWMQSRMLPTADPESSSLKRPRNTSDEANQSGGRPHRTANATLGGSRSQRRNAAKRRGTGNG
jgi:hypothetical protein